MHPVHILDSDILIDCSEVWVSRVGGKGGRKPHQTHTIWEKLKSMNGPGVCSFCHFVLVNCVEVGELGRAARAGGKWGLIHTKHTQSVRLGF